jgi:Protein of unknown function (DUF1574)
MRTRAARRIKHRRAWQALASGLLLFAAVQGGLAWAVERAGPYLRDPVYADRAVRLHRRLAAADSPRCVLLLGSSRTAYGARTQLLEDYARQALHEPVVAFNFGTPGAGPVTNLVYFRRLLAEGVRPDLVFIEVMPAYLATQVGEPTLRGSPPAEMAWTNPERFTGDEIAVLASLGVPTETVSSAYRTSSLLPGVYLRHQLVSRVWRHLLPWYVRFDFSRNADAWGWNEPMDTGSQEGRAQGIANARKDFVPHLTNYQPGGPAGEALRATLELCREHHAAAALVLMPEGETFRGWYSPEALTRLDAFLSGLTREFGVPVIDARTWVAERDTSDSHHLLRSGATTFSERFAREAVVPLLAGGPSPAPAPPAGGGAR